MASHLLGTRLLFDHLKTGGTNSRLLQRKLRDIAVSAVSLEWILADAEKAQLSPHARLKWRTNVVRFRERLTSEGGGVLPLSLRALEHWGRLQLLELKSTRSGVETELATEERLVIATAAANGLIYLCDPETWLEQLQHEIGLASEVVP